MILSQFNYIMQQKIITIGNIRLAYLEKNPSAVNIIFFIHGNSGSSYTWIKQFHSELLNTFRLIAFDLPGCGHSDITNETDWNYSCRSMGKVLAAAVKQLAGNDPYALVGFSLGTNIIGEMLEHPVTPVALTLASSCVASNVTSLDKVFKEGDSIFFYDNPEYKMVHDFFSTVLSSPTEEDIRNYVRDFYAAKPPFRSALIKSLIIGEMSDEIKVINEQSIPVLVVFGLEDKILHINYLDNQLSNFWKDNVYKLSRSGHFLPSDQPAEFNILLTKYLQERFNDIPPL